MTKLFYEPLERKKRPLSNELKDILRKKFKTDCISGKVLSGADLVYLEALRDVGIIGIEELLEAIGVYVEIVLEEVD